MGIAAEGQVNHVGFAQLYWLGCQNIVTLYDRTNSRFTDLSRTVVIDVSRITRLGIDHRSSRCYRLRPSIASGAVPSRARHVVGVCAGGPASCERSGQRDSSILHDLPSPGPYLVELGTSWGSVQGARRVASGRDKGTAQSYTTCPRQAVPSRARHVLGVCAGGPASCERSGQRDSSILHDLPSPGPYLVELGTSWGSVQGARRVASGRDKGTAQSYTTCPRQGRT
ncbi:hypothetical protein J6590_031437 [Homalodisca vitripennis]|nr:hypothetical protein J6590_031437 [Homalodisca vitripennis]